jgi:hypothetical protein
MLREVLGYARRLVALQSTVDRQGERLDKVESTLEKVRQDLGSLVDLVKQFQHEHERDREMAERDRENLLLRLENALLRMERRLPTAPSDERDDEQ